MQRRAKLIKRVSWTETLRAMEPGEFIEAELSERINIVRHITRIGKLDNKKFTTRKTGRNKLIVTRVS